LSVCTWMIKIHEFDRQREIHKYNQCVSLSIYAGLSFCLSVCLKYLYLSVCLSVRLSVCLSVCLSVYACTSHSVCVHVCVSLILLVCMYMCGSICVCIYINACVRWCIHTYTHIICMYTQVVPIYLYTSIRTYICI